MQVTIVLVTPHCDQPKTRKTRSCVYGNMQDLIGHSSRAAKFIDFVTLHLLMQAVI